MEMDRKLGDLEIAETGIPGKLEKAAEPQGEPVEGRLEQAAEMVTPLMHNAPTGLFDRFGIPMLEGDCFTADRSNIIFQVRYSDIHGFIGLFERDYTSVFLPLAAEERAFLNRRRLKRIARINGNVLPNTVIPSMVKGLRNGMKVGMNQPLFSLDGLLRRRIDKVRKLLEIQSIPGLNEQNKN